jgi:hypothetical protein
MPNFPGDTFPTLRSFWEAVLQKFSASALSSCSYGLAAGGQQRPMEAQFGDEFYRAAYALLGEQSHLTSEWCGEEGTGRIDLFVREPQWAIELLRDGDRIGDHMKRFATGGVYHPWIIAGKIKDYVVLDFRRTIPSRMIREFPETCL